MIEHNDPTVFLDGRVTLWRGDCSKILKAIPDNSVDAAVMDPPYALESIRERFGGDTAAPATPQKGSAGAFARSSRGFMGKQWDTGEVAFDPEFWREVYRVLKPGAFLVSFSGTRTYHHMAAAIDAAGFEVRDSILDMLASDTAVSRFLETLSVAQVEAFFRCIEDSQFGGMLAWAYGTGFPKSHSVPKGIEQHRFQEWLDANPVSKARYRRLNRWAKKRDKSKRSKGLRGRIETAFRRRAGVIGETIGTETIVNDMRNSALLNVGKVDARDEYTREITAYSLPEAAEWDGWGTALKPAWEPICLARKPLIGTVAENVLAHGTGGLNVGACKIDAEKVTGWGGSASGGGTWNQDNSGLCKNGEARPSEGRFPANIVTDGSAEVLACFPDAPGAQGKVTGNEASPSTRNTHGTFNARAPSSPRNDTGSSARFFYSAKADGDDRLGSSHPTVKPVDLMRWLVRMVCRKGGTVLDPFAGTGTTGEAAFWEGCNAILVEREPEYQADIAKRMSLVLAGPDTKKRARTKPEPAEDLPLFGGETVAKVAAVNEAASSFISA